MLTDGVKATLRESGIGREMVGFLHSTDRFTGFYGDGPTTAIPGGYHVRGHPNGEVQEVARALTQQGLLDFSPSGRGFDGYCFHGENHAEPTGTMPGHMKPALTLNPGLRAAVGDFLTDEFPSESRTQEINELAIRARSAREGSERIISMKGVARHYADVLETDVLQADLLKYPPGWDGSLYELSRHMVRMVERGTPFVVYDAHPFRKLLIVARGDRVHLLGRDFGCAAMANPVEYSYSISLMSARDPFEDPYLLDLIARFDGPEGKQFTSVVDINQIGLRYEGSRCVMEELTENNQTLINGFRAESL